LLKILEPYPQSWCFPAEALFLCLLFQDYSAQWADYYRSLGMMKEAEMIESQARGSAAAAPQPQAAPQPGMAAQPDYSAQWAEYYRSIGTHSYQSAQWAKYRYYLFIGALFYQIIPHSGQSIIAP
jgi:hypothetical protein